MSLYLKIIIVFVTTVLFYTFYYLIFPKFRKRLIVFDSNNIVFISWVFTTILLSIIVTIKHYSESDTLIFKILIQTIVFSIIPTFNFVIKPYLFSFFNKKNRDKSLEKILPKGDKNTRIYISEVTNAFALGVAGYGKIIIIGKELINSMNNINIKGILFHELAHHKFKHVRKIYSLTFIVSFVISSILILTQHYFRPYVHISIIVTLNGALYGLLMYYSMSFQKKMEYNADKFAADNVGTNDYIDTLNTLNQIKNGSLEKKSLTHPTLTERIEHLNKSNEIL